MLLYFHTNEILNLNLLIEGFGCRCLLPSPMGYIQPIYTTLAISNPSNLLRANLHLTSPSSRHNISTYQYWLRARNRRQTFIRYIDGHYSVNIYVSYTLVITWQLSSFYGMNIITMFFIHQRVGVSNPQRLVTGSLGKEIILRIVYVRYHSSRSLVTRGGYVSAPIYSHSTRVRHGLSPVR